jgi:hypothetical protein
LHPFELYPAIQQIQHRRTDIGSPETNGFCECFHRTQDRTPFQTSSEGVAQMRREEVKPEAA